MCYFNQSINQIYFAMKKNRKNTIQTIPMKYIKNINKRKQTNKHKQKKKKKKKKKNDQRYMERKINRAWLGETSSSKANE